MLTKNFHKLQTKVSAHVAADQVRRGSYNTCFIGCLAKRSNSPEFIEREYGIPVVVSRIAESIFEGLPLDEGPLFFAAFPDAVESDGKNLTRVCWQFLAAELRSLPPVEPEVQAAIDTVIKGMDLLAEGKEWPEEDARAAYAAAEATRPAPQASSAADCAASAAAVRAAFRAAASAGWAASDAASAAYWASSANRAADWVAASAARVAVFRRQRDLLLRLIKEAPITRSVGVSSVVLLVNETHD